MQGSNDEPRKGVTRRSFLKGAAAGTAAAAFAAQPFFVNRRLFAAGPYQTEYVILLQYSGGVRTYETWDTPGNIPEQMALKPSGALHRVVQAPSNGHSAAKTAIVSGGRRFQYNRKFPRNEHPTIYEYFRKQLDIPASEVWHVAESESINNYLNYSIHEDYGAEYGANFLAPDAFRNDYRDLLRRFATIQQSTPDHETAVAQLRDSMDVSRLQGVVDLPLGNTSSERDKISRFLLDHAATGYSGSNDVRALKICLDLIDEFRPRLLGVTLNTHDTGHGSYSNYVRRIGESDELVGQIWDKIQEPGNPMRDKTTMILIPEHGRDENANQQGGYDHSIYNDPSTRYVSLFAIGPDIKQGVDLTDTVSGVLGMQAMATLAELMGVETPETEPGIGPITSLFTSA